MHSFQGEDNKKGKKKKSADLIELPIDEQLPGNSTETLQKYRDEEVGTARNLCDTTTLVTAIEFSH